MEIRDKKTQSAQLAYEAHTVLMPGVKGAFVYF